MRERVYKTTLDKSIIYNPTSPPFLENQSFGVKIHTFGVKCPPKNDGFN